MENPQMPTAGAVNIAWPEAIARLAAERTRAVTCAGRARSWVTLGLGSEIDVARFATQYGEAKAEFDGVIAGLSVALIEGRPPMALGDLQQQLASGVRKREAFCRQFDVFASAKPSGMKGEIADLLGLGSALKQLTEALLAIWDRIADAEKLRRDTIRAQLEATRWPNFTDVPPAF